MKIFNRVFVENRVFFSFDKIEFLPKRTQKKPGEGVCQKLTQRSKKVTSTVKEGKMMGFLPIQHAKSDVIYGQLPRFKEPGVILFGLFLPFLTFVLIA